MRPFPSSTLSALSSPRRFSPRTALTVTLLASVFLSIVSNAEARLGDSPRQCIKRYGAPVGTTTVPGFIPNGVEFHRGEYSVICGFEEEVCTVVVVLRLSPLNPTLQGIPRDDISLFMEENFGSTYWTHTVLNNEGKFWRTDDWRHHRSYRASYTSSLQMLTMQIERQ